MLQLVLTYWRRGSQAIKTGVTLVKLRRIKVLQEAVRAKSTVSNDDYTRITRITARLERSIDQLESIYA